MKKLTVANFRSGFDHFRNGLQAYFGNATHEVLKNLIEETIEIEFNGDNPKNFDEAAFAEYKIDFLFLNLIFCTETTCKVIKRIKVISPGTKIIFVSSVAKSISQEIFSAGATACIQG